MREYETIVDDMMQFFAQDQYRDDVEQGKAMFFERAGILDEESDEYESRIIQFSHWFLLTRPLLKSGTPPIEACFSIDDFDMSEEQIKLYENLKAQRHSLFEFIKYSGDKMVVRDLFSKYKIKVEGDELKHGFNKGDVFEARLVPHADSFYFTKSFCFHPPEAVKFIIQEIKRINKLPVESHKSEREGFMFKLYKMRCKYEQFTHVPMEMIYTNDSKMKF